MPISCPSKRKRQGDQDGKAERVLKKTKDSSLPTSEIEQESAQQQKKKKRKERVKEGKTHGVGNDSMVEADKAKTDDTTQDEPAENTKPSNDKSVEINADENPTGMKKKKKKNKTPESNKNEDGEETKKGSIVQIEDKKAEVKPTRERKYADGLVVEELKMGRQNGKRAFPGTRVSVRYTVNLKENGEIVESKYLVFLLGVGKVIKGLDVGLNGMLVGGKRKLTIPPSMGFKERVNDWLDMDIELLDVR
ncbi:Peptidylprolyl isomerase [Thalictrum thalictroides]|uniref:peptidylprolyl isomerase n=1 Tax=Thalictrum thalictroides TaxID=46969 RepID=A0A7J6WRS4_THATH|nr:Peptidylprolyl isomerase [Thalictrum thalictroides]